MLQTICTNGNRQEEGGRRLPCLSLQRREGRCRQCRTGSYGTEPQQLAEREQQYTVTAFLQSQDERFARALGLRWLQGAEYGGLSGLGGAQVLSQGA